MAVPPIGSAAPDFEIMTDRGEAFRLTKQRGRPVVLYFYPEDDTEGCTIENIEFTAEAPEFRNLGVELIGISPDTVEKHCKFRDKHKLGVQLGADPDHKVIEAFGLWQLKKMFGVEFMGVKRATVLVDADGKVAGVFYATRIKGHAEKVLAEARALAAAPKAKASSRRRTPASS